MTSPSNATRLHRAWVIAGVTFLTLIAAAAFRSTTSVLFEPLEMHFGWTRSQTSLAVTVNLIFYGLTAPFAAVFMERFTIKRTAMVALTLIGLGTGLTLTMTEVWQLVLYWGVFVGLGTGALALVFASIVANRWFETRRGLVTGIFSAAYATGQLLFLPLIAHLVMDSGWQLGSLVVTLLVAALIPIFFVLFKEKPADVGLLPYGATEPRVEEPAPRTVKATITTLTEAFRSKAFWVLAGTFFVCGWTTNGLIGAHFIPAAHDHGMPATTAASLLAIVGIFDFIGTILSGWLTDKFGINWNFAPVLDVNNNPANPVIGVRSFGADPCTTSRPSTRASPVRPSRRASRNSVSAGVTVSATTIDASTAMYMK